MAKSAEIPSSGFPPIARADARILILGSLPGQRSLQTGEYYAHPQNAFWTIMQSLVGVSGNYQQRAQGLMDAGIALWDVLLEASRPGSLDANIRAAGLQVNDFNIFLDQHKQVCRVAFNGRKAEALFRRHVGPGLRGKVQHFVSLPSTSPAYASVSVDEKAAIWRSMLG